MSNDPTTQLGWAIQNARIAADLTQDELAIKIGKTQQSISRWEQGLIMPPLERLTALAHALNIPREELLVAAADSAEKTRGLTPVEPSRIEALESDMSEVKGMLRQLVEGQQGRPLRAVSTPAPGRTRKRKT